MIYECIEILGGFLAIFVIAVIFAFFMGLFLKIAIKIFEFLGLT